MQVEIDGGEILLSLPGGPLPAMTACPPLAGVYVYETADENTLFIGFDRNQAAVAVLLAKDGTPSWRRARSVEWKHVLEIVDTDAEARAADSSATESNSDAALD